MQDLNNINMEIYKLLAHSINIHRIPANTTQITSYGSQSCKASHEIIVLKYMGERVPTSYNQEPVVHGETTHKSSWSRSGGGGVDGDGSGGQSPSQQGVEIGTSNPRNFL